MNTVGTSFALRASRRDAASVNPICAGPRVRMCSAFTGGISITRVVIVVVSETRVASVPAATVNVDVLAFPAPTAPFFVTLVLPAAVFAVAAASPFSAVCAVRAPPRRGAGATATTGATTAGVVATFGVVVSIGAGSACTAAATAATAPRDGTCNFVPDFIENSPAVGIPLRRAMARHA